MLSIFAAVILPLIALGALLFILYVLIRPITKGAIYFPTRKDAIETMAQMANARPGMKLVDIGSGDGRIIIAFAKMGLETHGYEINPLLVMQSRRAIKKAGLEGKTFVHGESFWHADLSKFDIVTVYGIGKIMEPLGEKLKRELKPGAKIISNVYQFHGLKEIEREGYVRRYSVL